MNKIDLILVGGGGHAKACIDVIRAEGIYNVAGIVDVEEKLHTRVLDHEIIASDNDLPGLLKKHQNFHVSLGIRKDFWIKVDKFEHLKQLGALFPVVVSPLAFVSDGASIDDGTIVMHNALINTGARIGKNCIINTAAVIEHDAIIGDHCHISTGSIINGKCQIGRRVFIGSNSTVIDFVEIADDVVIGAGSVVVKSIKESGVYVGNPVRRVNNLGK